MEMDTTWFEPTVSVVPLLVGQPTSRKRSCGHTRSTTSNHSAPSNRQETPSRPSIELVLYVSSGSPHSMAALRNLRRTLAQYAGDAVTLTVCDLSKDPSLADRDGVHFTPSLVANGPGPRTWIVGHLGNPQVLQAFLESALEPKQ
jgi:KaiB domain